MKFKTNNYRRTLRLKQDKPRSPRHFWLIKLALLILRLVCKLIDLFSGESDED
ncbi:hypothetical protein SAMN05421686_11448 [Thalassolituus maritimus]|uniref:Uncharacterized protein n=1 Tax=Thalassolituus maritimus TaxID=484498 RepID=A0A1N7Q6T5_9GAMM|nr:hypothetical protein SAMN05421686_11448 [Thalassolituus maritimus]